jgi:hypothetical protein
VRRGSGAYPHKVWPGGPVRCQKGCCAARHMLWKRISYGGELRAIAYNLLYFRGLRESLAVTKHPTNTFGEVDY